MGGCQSSTFFEIDHLAASTLGGASKKDTLHERDEEQEQEEKPFLSTN